MENMSGLETLSEECFLDSLKMIYLLTGITISINKKSMVKGRLHKRAKEIKMTSYEEYLQLVKKDLKEKAVFIDLVTTNETYFFRTPRIWNYIFDIYLPQWIVENSGRSFLVWSAAAASGEEVYSLGILLQAFKEKNPRFKFQILGTDISSQMINLCQGGVYKGRSIENFKITKKEWFKKYMQKQAGGKYQVIPEIRSQIKFQTHNLFKLAVNTNHFDLVLLRNVLIYFTKADQEKVLSLIEPSLKDSGVLIIGESESLSNIKTGYVSIQPLVYKKENIFSEEQAS